MRTLIIGDIHGNIRSLKEVLDLAAYQPEKDRIICIGDYIDGWEQPVEVVDLLIDLKERSPHQNIYLMGNHDTWLLAAMQEGINLFRDRSYIESKYYSWISQGGDKTYEAYYRLTDEQWNRQKNHFFRQLLPHYIENNKLFVHAGFDPSIGWEKTLESNPDSLLWDRTLFEQAFQQWILKDKVSEKCKPFDAFDTIYIGHTPTIKFGLDEPKRMGNVINVDQGCKLTGRLTVWIDQQELFFQTVH